MVRITEKSLCSDDGDRILYSALSQRAESWIWNCAEGKRTYRWRDCACAGNDVR